MKRMVLVGALVGACAVTAFAQTKDKGTAQGHTAPKTQPATGPAVNGAAADGTRLGPYSEGRESRRQAAAGRHLSGASDAAERQRPTRRATASLERWVEFVKGGKVAGREVVTIIPQSEISQVQKDTPPQSELVEGRNAEGRRLRPLWINKGGNHYLITSPRNGLTRRIGIESSLVPDSSPPAPADRLDATQPTHPTHRPTGPYGHDIELLVVKLHVGLYRDILAD